MFALSFMIAPSSPIVAHRRSVDAYRRGAAFARIAPSDCITTGECCAPTSWIIVDQRCPSSIHRRPRCPRCPPPPASIIGDRRWRPWVHRCRPPVIAPRLAHPNLARQQIRQQCVADGGLPRAAVAGEQPRRWCLSGLVACYTVYYHLQGGRSMPHQGALACSARLSARA